MLAKSSNLQMCGSEVDVNVMLYSFIVLDVDAEKWQGRKIDIALSVTFTSRSLLPPSTPSAGFSFDA